MTEFLLSFVIVFLAFGAMSVGPLLGRRAASTCSGTKNCTKWPLKEDCALSCSRSETQREPLKDVST